MSTRTEDTSNGGSAAIITHCLSVSRPKNLNPTQPNPSPTALPARPNEPNYVYGPPQLVLFITAKEEGTKYSIDKKGLFPVRSGAPFPVPSESQMISIS